jgi:cation diffusion facilitator family transporter
VAQGGISENRRRAERVALVSLIAAIGLVAAKTIAGIASGSIAILSEAAHSGVDAAATGLAYLTVRIASRPPDKDHPYGHDKAENVFALLQAAGLIVLSLVIALEAVTRLQSGTEVSATWYAFGVIALSIAVDLSRAIVLRRAGRLYRSPALVSDAFNFTADLFTSSAVLVGLVFVSLGYHRADAIGGLLVSLVVAGASIRLGKRSVDVLMDRAPAGVPERIRTATRAVAGVAGVRRVRVREIGGRIQTDVVVSISRTVPLERAREVTEEVERVIHEIEPEADVIVQVEPVADERVIAERVTSIAAREPEVSQVHNVHVTAQPDGLHITLHAKFPDTMALGRAHEISERLEAEIAAEIPGVARVDTHLEPLEGARSRGADVTARQQDLVDWAKQIAERQSEVQNCHEVIVTETDGRLSLVMHCEAAPGLSVSDVHRAATGIENEIHAGRPEVDRVTVHFEPAEWGDPAPTDRARRT